MSWLRRPNHATVVAYLALFVALSGTSYAAITVTGDNVRNESLTGRDVRDGSLGGRDVGNSTLTTSDVKNSSLRREDFLPGSLPRGDRGPAGPQGAQGDTGQQGAPGEPAPASGGPLGPAGPAGPAGQAGPAGVKGDTGAAGADGEAGPRGPEGQPGSPGSTGSRGPSNGYYFETNSDKPFVNGETLGTLELPAGNYIVMGKLWLDNQDSTSGRAIRCYMKTASTEIDRGKSGLAVNGGRAADEQVMTLIGGTELSTAGEVALSCDVYNGQPETPETPPNARWTRLTAIKVDDLARQTP